MISDGLFSASSVYVGQAIGALHCVLQQPHDRGLRFFQFPERAAAALR